MAKSYLERAFELFKKEGWLIAKTETYNAFSGTRADMFGWADAVAIHPAHGIAGVQICGADWSPHVKKLTGQRKEQVILWLASGGRCILIGWRKLKGTWTERIREFTLEEDFPEITPEILVALQNSKSPDSLFARTPAK